MLVALILGDMSYIPFIDDYVCNILIYLLNTKDEVFSRFQEFNSLVKNQRVKKIKFLRIDNGSHYTSKEYN